MKILRIVGFSNGRPSPHDGRYVVAFDPDAYDGLGDVQTSADPHQAIKFNEAIDAWNLWRKVSTKRPRRADGKPNKPMTAFTIEIISFSQLQ